jgi:hypothetical protein
MSHAACTVVLVMLLVVLQRGASGGSFPVVLSGVPFLVLAFWCWLFGADFLVLTFGC